MKNNSTLLKNIAQTFSNAFWSGKRWVIFPSKGTFIYLKSIQFYTSFQRANSYCNNRSIKGREYRFIALADALKEINNCSKNSNRNILFSPAHKIHISYPITAMKSSVQMEQGLLSGNYLPVLWNKKEYDSFENITHQFGIIVRYNKEKKSFQFFDGKFKRILPGQQSTLGEGGCFDFNGVLLKYLKNNKVQL